MRKRTLAVLGLAGGLVLALAGCTTSTTVTTGNPGATLQPPGHGRGWGQPNPRLVVIEGTGIQYVADIDEDIFISGGVWFRFSNNVWFSCRSYGGSWTVIKEPPAVFYRIPPGHAKYRVVKGHPGPGGGPRKSDDDDKPGQGHGRKDR